MESLSLNVMDKRFLQELDIIDLSHNMLTGEVPALRLRKLKNLNLSNNRLSALKNL